MHDRGHSLGRLPGSWAGQESGTQVSDLPGSYALQAAVAAGIEAGPLPGIHQPAAGGGVGELRRAAFEESADPPVWQQPDHTGKDQDRRCWVWHLGHGKHRGSPGSVPPPALDAEVGAPSGIRQDGGPVRRRGRGPSSIPAPAGGTGAHQPPPAHGAAPDPHRPLPRRQDPGHLRLPSHPIGEQGNW